MKAARHQHRRHRHGHHHHHHQGDPGQGAVPVQRQPLAVPFPRSDDPGRKPVAPPATPAPRVAVRRALLPPHAATPLALPPEMYLVGCAGAIAPGLQPSAQTMGFKAWNLLRMSNLALPVPPAFVLGTHYCIDRGARELASSPALWTPGLHALEAATGLVFGDARRPLLLSVRSGAPVSMPGMMETLLNVGLCDATVGGLLRLAGNPRLAWDAYRRFVATYGEVVAGLPASVFEEAAASLFGARDERDLDFIELRQLTRRFLEVYAQAAGKPFPQEPRLQLSGAIAAILASWQSARACEYRRLNGLSDAIGTAVTVQAMVFGNAGGQSGAGVGFTPDPARIALDMFDEGLIGADLARERTAGEAARTITLGDTTLREGDLLTLDGNEGKIYAGAAQTELEYPVELLARLESLRKRHDGKP